MVSPQATTETISTIVAQLEAQRTELETRLRALQSYLVPDHPNIVEIEKQIEAVNNQIDQERAKLTSPSGNRLNRQIEEFQSLEMKAAFAQDVYQTALAEFDNGRDEVKHIIKQKTVNKSPTM